MIVFILIQMQSGNYLIFYLDYNIKVIYIRLNGLHRMGLYSYNKYG